MKFGFSSKAAFIVVIMFPCLMTRAQDDFYDISTIQDIEISFSQSNWDYMMDTAKAGSGSYLMAQWVKVNGVQFDSAGVKYKGSSSYDPDFAKNPLHISLDEFKNQSYQGIASIKLANFYGDPSMIREPLAYAILDRYMDCSGSNFATVTINGNLMGLYSNDESVNKRFCSTHFYSSGNTFIKGSPLVPGPFSKSNLKYISADSSDYFGKYEIESDHGWNDLAELCDIVTNQPASLNATVDIDRALWMLAFNNVLVSLDSYSGWFSQNHYLYRDNTGHYNPVIWDLNMAFGGFPFAGTQNGGSGSLTVQDMKLLNPLLHDFDLDWPLIAVILSNLQWKRMYVAHLRTIIEENFSNGSYLQTALMMQSLVDDIVQSDPNKFFTYEQFQQGLTGDVQFGSYVVPGIQNLMDARADYLLQHDLLNDEPPLITDVSPDIPEPLLNDEVTVNATVTGQGNLNVFLGLRLDKEEKFGRQEMYDDGQHNDGLAGDGIYGASFIISSLYAQYYIYAEVDATGPFAAAFSPARAEHEFYSIAAEIPTAIPGDVAINEFLAKNVADTVNEYGNHEDWVELVNLTGDPLDLFGLYLTDDFTNPDKFAFPEGTVIGPYGYLTVWADEEDTASSFIHANFKLSGNGEELMLSDGDGVILDSLTFGAQSDDISLGRCPNGSGLWDFLEFPTFGTDNYCPEAVNEIVTYPAAVWASPNPFNHHLTVVCDQDEMMTAELINSSGLILSMLPLNKGRAEFNTSSFPSGLYLVLLRDDHFKIHASGKFIKLK